MDENSGNRFDASLLNPFPVFTPSPEALRKIQLLDELSETRDAAYYLELYDILIQDQAKSSLRVHKGYPLYRLSLETATHDKDKALRYMYGAFIEDVLTHGYKALGGFAAGALTGNYGASSEGLVDMAEFVLEKTKATFLPLTLLEDFLRSTNTEITTKTSFQEVTPDTMAGIVVAQVRKKLEDDLRPSFRVPPTSESEVQNVVFALLRQVDQTAEREMGGTKFAGKEFRIDFSLFQNKVGVEVKLIRESSDLGKTIDQINGDIPAYLSRYKWLVFVVYDACNGISDRRRFIKDLSGGRPNVVILPV